MNSCQRYRDLIEQYLDGMIGDAELAELRAHAQDCPSCREEFDRCVLLQETIGESFSSGMTTEQGAASVLARLAEQPDAGRGQSRLAPAWLAGRQTAVAAGILLAAGLLLGFALGRTSSVKPAEVPLPDRVSMSVADLQGTVLVRHEGSDVWQILTAESDVYLGDTFHSAAKAGFTLELKGESRIEVDQNSMLALTSYNGETQFFLEHGECTANLESPHGPFFISTPHGRVEALGTEFTVKVIDE